MIGKLSIVSSEEPEGGETFRDRVKSITEKRQAEIILAVQKCIAFWAEFGAEELILAQLPITLSETDRAFVATWLEEDGFSVKRNRWNGSITVQLGE
jgi:hypothetical protein